MFITLLFMRSASRALVLQGTRCRTCRLQARWHKPAANRFPSNGI